MPLARGALLGPYRVDAEIGSGGMGHVFRATDTRLDRAVAIKVLPEHRWSDPQLRHRFEREARALSSLSHPNLCSLYDIGELSQSGGTIPYLVMELLEGETLRDRLQNGRVGMRKALMWAAQIAHGLAAAHQKGVIHRDLKPENVFITEGELLKILDFGLATTQQLSGDSATLVRTQPGMVMGTANYMSPEQVRGNTLDARSDIFSLGIVLYEMLTGQVPFHARSPVEIMNAILIEEPPDIGSLISIPENVEELVWRCLEKDPARRFSSARDLAFALESAAKTMTSATPAPARRRTSAPAAVAGTSSMRTRAIILALMAASIIAVAVLSRDTPAPEPPRLRTLTYSGRDNSPAASPDGRLIAFVSSRDGRRRIWLKQLADGTEAAITSGPDDAFPRFAPDGSVLLFTRTENGVAAIHRVPVVGGEPRKLIDNAFDGDWSPDGKQIAFIRNRGERNARTSALCVTPTTGGAAREIVTSTTEELKSPRWAPSGNSIVVTRAPRGTIAGSLLVIDLVSGDKQTLTRSNPHGPLSAAAWVKGGAALVYAELDAVVSNGLPGRGRGSAIVLHDLDGGHARVLLRNPHSSADTVDVTGTGSLIFSEDFSRQSLREVTLDGSGHERWLSRGMSVDRQPSYARGGQSVVFTSDRAGSLDIWELMLDSGSLRRITDHDGIDWDPYPSPDGKSLFWSSNRGGHFEIWTAAFDGASPQQVTQDGVDAENPSLPSSGDWIFYDSSNPRRDALHRLPRGGGRSVVVLEGETAHPEVSADGAFVAYQRPDGGGSTAIEVVRVADGSVFPFARGFIGVTRARWIGSTHTIAFRERDSNGTITLFAQEFRAGTDTTSTRRQLMPADPDATPETFAISPDGKRAVLAIVDEASGLMMAEGIEGISK
ncbi:MAG TPA: protein kinase [Thermoanaerobaculia bacterium]|nr:protein kinase [Thermoanaerobaculia bacterium]